MFDIYFDYDTSSQFDWPKRLLVIGSCWLTIITPPIGIWLKQSMHTHMLVQLSLLVLIGVAIGQQLNKYYPQLLYQVKVFRAALLLLAIATMMIWMIPRLLDLAVENTWVDAAKVLSLPLLAGLPLYFAWQNFGPIVRGILHLEALATLLRLAWLYIESPTRLCVQYGLDDQKRLGTILIAIAIMYALYLLTKVMGNPFQKNRIAKDDELYVYFPTFTL
jgi:uncharacterized membrane protein YqaE (UPF0057 family)